MPRILIVQASPVASQEQVAAFGAKTNVEMFTEVLTSAWGPGQPPLEFFTLNIADAEKFPQGMAAGDFAGAVITGSPLNVYHDAPAVTGQIELAREIFHAGVPTFGSCWGLQLMTAALGGSVRLNPKGREFGIARNITLNEAGRAHVLYEGKATAFDALCSHQDEVDALPACGTVLASNAISRVQAAVMDDGEKSFWGVQYHPEMDFNVIAALMLSRARRYAGEGFAPDEAAIAAVASDYRALAAEPASPGLAWRLGATRDVLDPGLQRIEFANWLRVKVAPRVMGA
jgi:GMP synthase (glutamine-hydrolysing)